MSDTTQPFMNRISRLSKPAAWLWRATVGRHWLLVLVFVVVVSAFLILGLDSFFTDLNLLNIARTLSWIAIAAFGESMVIIIGGIDLSVGAVMGLAGLISALCMRSGFPVYLAIVAGLLTGGLVGWVNGTIVGRVKLPPFIVTLATMSIVRGAIHGLSGGWSVTDLPEAFRMLGQHDVLIGPISVPMPFLLTIGLAILVSLLMNQTLLGRYIYALADSEEALLISSVNVSQAKMLAYTICGLLAAMGGLLMTARLGVATPTAAVGYELDVIAAAVIGGTSLFGGRGSVLGVLLGAAFMQVLRNGLVLLGFPAYWQDSALGAMILLAVLLDYWQRDRAISWGGWLVGKGTEARRRPILNQRSITWLLIAAVLFLSGLTTWQLISRSSNRVANETPEARSLTIAWIPKALNNPVFELGRQGAFQKAAELTAEGSVEVELLYVGPVGADAAEQVRVIEEVIALGVDAIAVSCNDPIACIDPIDKAVSAGIPVMTWDADSPQSQRFAYLGVDNYQAGQAAADLLVRAMGSQGEVALLTGVPGALNLDERIRGFEDSIVSYPDIQIVATAASNDDINLGVQVVEETMQAHPNLDGWFFVGMWPLVAERGAMPLWEEAALQHGMKTVAFDTLPTELEMLRDGYLSGLVGQKYWGWGYETVQVIYDHIVNEKAFPSFIDSGFDIVTEKNVAAMLDAWESNDFTRVLPDPF